MAEPARNIELKLRFADLDRAARIFLENGADQAGELLQTDTYFHAARGRLKLREIAGKSAELIWYTRSDLPQSRCSDYLIVPAPDPGKLKQALALAYGIRAVVHKRRRLLMYQNVRIHLDEVERLGTFIEFEAVLSPGQTEQAGHERIDSLCGLVSATADAFERASYAELLLAKG